LFAWFRKPKAKRWKRSSVSGWSGDNWFDVSATGSERRPGLIPAVLLPVCGGRQTGGAFKGAGQMFQTAEPGLFGYVGCLEVSFAQKPHSRFGATPCNVTGDAFAEFAAERHRQTPARQSGGGGNFFDGERFAEMFLNKVRRFGRFAMADGKFTGALPNYHAARRN
jgi:hypothetical protein